MPEFNDDNVPFASLKLNCPVIRLKVVKFEPNRPRINLKSGKAQTNLNLTNPILDDNL